MDGVQLSQGQSHFKEAVYFLPKETDVTKSLVKAYESRIK